MNILTRHMVHEHVSLLKQEPLESKSKFVHENQQLTSTRLRQMLSLAKESH